MPFLSQGGSIIPVISDHYPVSTTRNGLGMVENSTFTQEQRELGSFNMKLEETTDFYIRTQLEISMSFYSLE